jgi:hypothetical protein
MPDYNVEFNVTITAESPRLAAQGAWLRLTAAQASLPTAFVLDQEGNFAMIDLEEHPCALQHDPISTPTTISRGEELARRLLASMQASCIMLEKLIAEKGGSNGTPPATGGD